MYSEEHKKYIKEFKKRNLLIKLVQVLILVIFLIIWQLLSDYNIINSFIFSSPYKVIKCLINLRKFI